MPQIKTLQLLTKNIFLILLIVIVLIITSAIYITSSSSKEENRLYLENQYTVNCSSCHIKPEIASIPKHIWKNTVLPEMALRMGLDYNEDGALKYSNTEKEHNEINNGYPKTPLIDSLKWVELYNYIIDVAPDSVPNSPIRHGRNSKLTQFESSIVIVNKTKPTGGIVNINYNKGTAELLVGDVFGQLYNWKKDPEIKMTLTSPIISSVYDDKTFFATEIGFMGPSEVSKGAVYRMTSNTIVPIAEDLHRPVYTEINDLNGDGTKEIIICEFGDLTGELSLLVKEGTEFRKRTLLALPGSIKVEVVDMNQDGKKDIIALFAQGREGIYIFYQKENLEFSIDPVILMPPEYGSSWFSLLDYNNDGHLDILLANGDNADYSKFLKPYHGIRLFINTGKNEFEEQWFYPINGSTRVLVDDFDMDGDFDFAVLSFFPDYANNLEEGFVYLENKDTSNYKFEAYTTHRAEIGNWLVMEKGDFDQDGDIDIVLGNFNMLAANRFEAKKECDLLWLENKHFK
jgi:hypothetical protein